MTKKNSEIAIDRISYAKTNKLLFIDLSYLGLDEIPLDISDMYYLLDINISNNKLREIPSSIFKLENLQYLNASNNDIRDINLEVGKFKFLNELDISNNQLNYIPHEFKYLNNTRIIFENNPFLFNLPPELREQELSYIIFYIDSLTGRDNKERLFETKLLIVGKGEVGKTTLMRTLKNPKFEVNIGEEKTTHGINIESFNKKIYFPAKKPFYNKFIDFDNLYERSEFPIFDEVGSIDESYFEYIPIHSWGLDNHSEELAELRISEEPFFHYSGDIYVRKEVKINMWDFGGQEILYSTHQFFLTQRSIYILVWDSRTDNEEESFDYWLNTIKRLSNNSPVIIVMNKSDVRIKTIDESSYNLKFDNILGFHNISCVSKKGVNSLIKQIENCIIHLPHIGDLLPSTWNKIREKLKATKQDYISLSKFKEICNLPDVENLKYISGYLKDLGDILHFYDDIRLKDFVILNSQWLTKAIYVLIHELEIQNNKGLFLLDDLEKYLDPIKYPQERHFDILQLMKKFEISFKLIGTKNSYIIPTLLGANASDINITKNFKSPESLKYQIEYKYMPSGIIERLICRLHNYLDKDNYWKYGAIFKTEYSKALVLSNKVDKTIDFYVIGDISSDLFNILRHNLNDINTDLKFTINDFDEKLACNCSICSTKNSPYMFNKKVLQKFLHNSKPKIDCQESTESVIIAEILSGYRLEKTKKQLLREFVKAFSIFQHKHIALKKLDEDERNSYLADLLKPFIMEYNFTSVEQARRGKSASGIKVGEIDFAIEEYQGTPITFYEGFNLSSLNRENIKLHFSKSILNYDPNGLAEKFIGVYCQAKSFLSLANRYFSYISSVTLDGIQINDTEDISDIYINGTEIKVYKSLYQRDNSRKLIAYHILVNLNL